MDYRPFSSVLIANRGEIACRIIRTAQSMGIRTIAVYSEVDAGALHTTLADSAIYIGGSLAKDSYLNHAALLAAAKATGAEAIHPAYGFLSENADFAQSVIDAGLIFIGPPPSAIRAMGDKAEAKRLMEAQGAPLLKGYRGEDQSTSAFVAAAESSGYPIILKPAAGGGGKGMKIAHHRAELEEFIDGVKREALASFGNSKLILERYLAQPRHVEVQIFGDSHGNIVHLFERDCTLQRRHQKVIEEAPAPNLSDATRALLHQTAINAGKAVGYVGAGTVEFLLEDNQTPYFMEMNTRLQVEHPVTEAITGLDLVEWQLRVAMGEPLPLAQSDIQQTGHAVEARLYAEDPAQGFLPQIGQITHLQFPTTLRVDAGVQTGDDISPYYDPMIAKIIAHAPTRAAALERLASGLDHTEITGLKTNRNLLRQLARHPVFALNPPDIGWLDRNIDSLATPSAPPTFINTLAAQILCLHDRMRTPHSGWRLNQPPQNLYYIDDQAHYVGAVTDLTLTHRQFTTQRNGQTIHGSFMRNANTLTVWLEGEQFNFDLTAPLYKTRQSADHEGHIRAPMPSRVTAIRVAVGQEVSKGTPLLVLEAMKMEHTLKAPKAGIIAAILYTIGDQVNEGDDLIEWQEAAS